MSIQELPTELLLAIGDCCEHYDAYSLALCCREFHNVLNKIVSKHRKVWRYWNTVDTRSSKRPFHEKLLKLARKPHLARYIETFKCGFTYDEPGAYTTFEEHDLLNYLETFATTKGCLLDDFRDERWHEAYLIGLHNFELRTLSNYLIYITPNLRRLECFGDTVGDADLLKLLVDVTHASTGTEGLPLQYLESIEVKLDRDITEGGIPGDWLLACMHLPRLQSFAASTMDGIIQRTSVDNLPSSNITKIVLQASTFETDCLIQVLSKINGLKSFAHESGESQLFNSYSAFSPKKITTALIKYAGHSLEHLTMRGEDEETPLYVETGEELLYASLAEFQRLKTLRCSTYLLTSDPQSPRPREALASGMDLVAQSSNEYKEAVKSYRRDAYLSETPETLRRLAFATRLPPTLKALHFEDYPCHTPLAYSALLEFVQKANNVLPRLNQIYLSDWGVEYLVKKGLLDIIALNSWKYKKLPNPFKIGIIQRGHSDSESDFEEETEEEYEI